MQKHSEPEGGVLTGGNSRPCHEHPSTHYNRPNCCCRSSNHLLHHTCPSSDMWLQQRLASANREWTCDRANSFKCNLAAGFAYPHSREVLQRHFNGDGLQSLKSQLYSIAYHAVACAH
jgi:hypothetical protein